MRTAVVPVALVLLAALAVVLTAPTTVRRAAVASPPGARAGLAELAALPLAAQGPVSAALGRAEGTYRVTGRGDGLQAREAALGMHASFGAREVSVSAAGIAVRLRVAALGDGSSSAPLAAAAPRARANRVSYRHPGGVLEWYANGPLGLEQGFTVARPAARAAGRLVLVLDVSGATATPLAGGRGAMLAGSGGGALRYEGLSAIDASGRALPAEVSVKPGRLLLAVEVRGARFPVRIDPFIRPGTTLPSGAQGVAISRDGDTILLAGAGSDLARVFVRSGETWSEQATLDTSPIEGSHAAALSADGSTALLGNEYDGESRGGALVFARTGSSWTRQGGVLRGAEQVGQAKFGVGVALSGDGSTALVGARGDHEAAGAAYVFARSGESWAQQGPALTGSGEEGRGNVGGSVALSADGDTALVGGWTDDGDLGAAWVFTRAGETWSQQGSKLTGGGEDSGVSLAGEGGYFGSSVSLSEDADTALIGGRGDADGRGAAWVFTRAGETWSQQGPKLTGIGEITIPKDAGEFGSSVALSGDGDVALVDGPGDNKGYGAVWAFARSGETWTQQGGKFATTEHGAYAPGVALSADGETALMGRRVLQNQEFTPEPPEIVRCEKQGPYQGDYSTTACDIVRTAGAYELSRGFVRGGFSSSLTEGTATLETVKGTKVLCRGESSTGSYAGHNGVAGVLIRLTGCELSGEACTSSGAAAGEVVTSTLEGVYGVERLGTSATTNKLALDLHPAAGEPFSGFACGSTAVAVRGSLLLPVFADKMESTSRYKYIATRGKQKPERFAGGPLDVLEASIDGGAWTQAGLTAKVTQTDEEKLEIDSVY